MHAARPVRVLSVIMAIFAVAAALPAQEAKVPVSELTLANGMKLLLVERHESPTVSAGWVAHVGSANESSGITGMAHLFEHMMFKGSRTIGTTDYAAEAKIMADLDALRVEMEKEYSRLREAKRRGEVTGSIYLPENETPRLAELRAKMKTLQDAQHELIVKDELDKVYTELGASGMNAFTNQDMTVYFVTVPENKLELWFWMESERLLNPVFREFYSERDVVREERRMRVESDPTAKFEEQFDFLFWGSIPYHHPVVGWPSDVESINRAEADRFFATYYAPNNLTAAIVGDFNSAEAARLAKTYLERIPRGTTEPPEVVTEEIEQLEPRSMEAEADTNPSVSLRWHAVPFVHRDLAPLAVLNGLLSDRTGRLYRALVEEKQVATGEPYSYVRPMKLAGLFEVGAEVADGHTHDQVKGALLAEIERLKSEPVGERELAKVKNRFLADAFRRLRSNMGLLIQLLYFDALGDWHFINTSPAAIAVVSAEDVARVTKAYFTETGINTLYYHRKEGTTVDPELAAVPAQMRPMVKQQLAQIAQIEDAEQLGKLLEQLRASAGQAPPEVQPVMELMTKRVEQRLAALAAASGKEE